MKNNIKKLRKDKKLTLSKLAELSGLSIGYLSHIESGGRNNPTYDVMKKISIALESSISNIFEL